MNKYYASSVAITVGKKAKIVVFGKILNDLLLEENLTTSRIMNYFLENNPLKKCC